MLESKVCQYETGYYWEETGSDGVYSIEEVGEYTKLIEPEGIILDEVIEGMKLEIEMRKWRHRNKLIRELIDAGFSPETAALAIEKEEQ